MEEKNFLPVEESSPELQKGLNFLIKVASDLVYLFYIK